MACARGKIDHMANLPDELLHLVFSYLPLHDKLRVESVSRRFQRCVLELMKREPQPLEWITVTMHRAEHFLNGYSVQSFRVADALRSLAKKAKFSEVKIGNALNEEQYVNTLLFILSESDCLDKVASFVCLGGPNQDILEKVIVKCVKLSTVTLDFIVPPPSNTLYHSLDLNRVFDAKPLTQLDLRLAAYPQEQLIELFHSIKPQTLQKLSLSFNHMPQLDLADTVRELNTNAWAALREMNLCWEMGAVVHVDLVNFFESLSLLSALERCDIHLHEDIQPINQLLAAMPSLFNSEKNIALSSNRIFPGAVNMSDCQVMAQIRQLQKLHPSVGVDFYVNDQYDALYLTLSNEKGFFEGNAIPRSCGDADCVDCHRFYPSIFSALQAIAGDCQDIHLDHYQLDKCRVNTVVEHLYYEGLEAQWRALTAETNDAGDLVTISFETIDDYEVDDEDVPPQHFEITVACGPCFSSSCIRCVNAE